MNNNNKRQREEGEDEEQQHQKRQTGGSASSSSSTAVVSSTIVATIPLQLSTAQRLDQHRLHSVFAYLTLHELAAVSMSCRLWLADASRLKGRGFKLNLNVDERIIDQLRSLSTSSVRHHVGSVVFPGRFSSESAQCQLIESLPLLRSLPSLTGVSLSLRSSAALLMAAETVFASTTSCLPLTLLQFCIHGKSTETVPLQQLFLLAASRLPTLQQFQLYSGCARIPMDFSPLLQLATRLTDMTISIRLDSLASIIALCTILKQMLRSIYINLVPASRFRFVDALFAPPHMLQKVKRLAGRCLTIFSDDLPLLAPANAPSLKHISAWYLELNSLQAVSTFLEQSWSLEILGRLQLVLNAPLPEDQADTLLKRCSRLESLMMVRTPLLSLRCLRFVPKLKDLIVQHSSQHLKAADIEYIYALTQLKSLQIVEDEPILLTAEVKAALTVPSQRMPNLTSFGH